jgi:hypothetical protein
LPCRRALACAQPAGADEGRAGNSGGAPLLTWQRACAATPRLLGRAGGMGRAHVWSVKIKTKIKAGPSPGCNEVGCLKA